MPSTCAVHPDSPPAIGFAFHFALPLCNRSAIASRHKCSKLNQAQKLILRASQGPSMLSPQPSALDARHQVALALASRNTFLGAAGRRDDLDVSMYLPWCAWTGIFAAIFLILMALFGACRLVHRFTRYAAFLWVCPCHGGGLAGALQLDAAPTPCLARATTCIAAQGVPTTTWSLLAAFLGKPPP